ncbi:MAG: aldo/keto reductase [Cyclobacteriaceae bacterium]|nr:aldo/keto reductase [Cyclobacteriaceae bacterium]
MKNIDPASVPKKKIYTGAEIPAIGLGTFGSDKYSPHQIAEAVKGAAAYGYRHFDCASVYGNEDAIGKAFSNIMKSGIKREELWITSKLWNDMHTPENVIKSCKKTLRDLQLDYLDLYLVHWPFPNFHAPGCDVASRSPDSKPYIHENYMLTWRAMEKLVDEGLVRHIGTSNMTIPKMELLLRDSRIKPVVNEMEIHPHFQQPELFNYLVDRNILPIGFSPLGSPSRPERDKTADDTVDMEDPVIVAAANKRGVHPAAICLKWAVQRGQITIPFSVKESQYKSNMDAIITDPLTEEEMLAIGNIDKNCRLIKGQVFLWKDDQSWGGSSGI